MTPQTMFDAMTANHCEEVCERFINAMHAQAIGKTRGPVTAATLLELYQDIEKWAERSLDKAKAA